ncbi:MAG: polysaccharide deacetylase family protein [Oscillospiraceae bacterium]|nr:polysaccharide deacetylase family protein [Oscillospiraceae bacterium]
MKRLFSVLLFLLLLPSPVGADDECVYLPVIMYHEVRPDKNGKDSILPEEFEADLKYLGESGYTSITMSRLIEYVYDGAPLPDRPVIISFDDGYLNNYIYALPILKKYSSKAVLSVIAGAADAFTEAGDENPAYAHLSWPRLLEMRDSGLIELQNHSYDMHKPGPRIGCCRMADETLTEFENIFTADAARAQEALYRHTGAAASTFAYPYGLSSPGSDAILEEMGFRASLSCDFGINRITPDPQCLFMLKRICRSHGSELKELLARAYQYSVSPS